EAADHARDLFEALVRAEKIDLALGALVLDRLEHAVVPLRVDRDLREMRDADDLMVPRHVAQLAPDHLRHRAADARVDLVEDVESGAADTREHALDREHRARELAAARDLAQRARLFAA